jgi:putative cardiolipin synthase
MNFFLLFVFFLSSMTQAQQVSEFDGVRDFNADQISCLKKHQIEEWKAWQLEKEWKDVISHQTAEEQRAWKKKNYWTFDSMKIFSSEAPLRFPGLVKVVEDGQEGLLTKVMMIRNATDSIDLAQMIFDSDVAGYFILNEIKLALQRGVNVRILIDPLFSLPQLQKSLKVLMTVEGGHRKNAKGELLYTEDPKTKKQIPVQASLEVRLFNPWLNGQGKAQANLRRFKNFFRSRMKRIDTNIGGDGFNRRMHDKLLATDLAIPEKAAVIVGGRAIQDAFNGISPEKYKAWEWSDMEVLVKNDPEHTTSTGNNPLFAEVGHYYDKIFYHLANKTLEANPWEVKFSLKTFGELARFINRGTEEAFRLFPELIPKWNKMEDESFLTDHFEKAPLRFVHELQNMHKKNAYDDYPEDNPINRINGASIMFQITEVIKEAKKSILIHTPYLYITAREINWLKSWLKEDPTRKLRIITNSVYTSDGGPPEAIVHHEIAPQFFQVADSDAIKNQVEIAEFGKLDDIRLGGQRMVGRLHGKFVIVDDHISLVTSHNSAPRSRHLNSENGFIIENEKISQQLTGGFERSREKCHLWGSEEWEKMRTHEETSMPLFLQKLAYPLMKCLNLKGLI